MPTSIDSLPEELLLVIFKLIFAATDLVHIQATLALVSQHWRNVIYHTPSLWTTIRSSTGGRRALLCLANSQEALIDVNMTVKDAHEYRLMGAMRRVLKHLHRWRRATLHIPFQQALLDGLAHPAPFLENLRIEPFFNQRECFFDPFKRQAPQLRSVSLHRVAIPWSTEMLCDLEELELTSIHAAAPGPEELDAILHASPRLSSLKLSQIHINPPFGWRPINLPLLQVLEIEELHPSFADNFLRRLKSGRCRILHLESEVAQTGESIFNSLSALVPLMNPSDSRAEIVFSNWKVWLTLESTSDQALCIGLEGDAEESILLQRLIHETIPAEILQVETKLLIQVRGDDPNVHAWIDASDAMHVTSLEILGVTDNILEQLATPVDGRWLFPFLQTVAMTIEDADPGKVAEMVKNRHSLGKPQIPLPMPFTSLSISDACLDHALDRAIIESVIGPERLTWEMKKDEMVGAEEIKEYRRRSMAARHAGKLKEFWFWPLPLSPTSLGSFACSLLTLVFSEFELAGFTAQDLTTLSQTPRLNLADSLDHAFVQVSAAVNAGDREMETGLLVEGDEACSSGDEDMEWTPSYTRNATERVLGTPELLLRILQDVGWRTDLRNAALVCRSWYDWAREAQWTTCRTSMRDIVAYSQMGCAEFADASNGTILDGRIINAIMQRFFFCTRRIVKMSWNDYTFPSGFLEHAQQASPGNLQTLFPRLQSMTLILNDVASAAAVAPIIGSAFRDGFVQPDPPPPLIKSVSTLEARIRQLNITLTSSSNPPDFSFFPELRSLHYSWGRISRDACARLTLCPFLEDLVFDQVKVMADGGAAPEQDYLFPSLHTLRLDVRETPEFIPNIILSSSFPALRSIDYAARLYPDNINTLVLRRLQNQKSPLETIVMAWWALDVHRMQCHLDFKRLRTLHLVICHGMEIDDEDFERLAVEMSGLQVLFLRAYPQDAGSVQLTEKALLSLARHVDFLIKLTITITYTPGKYFAFPVVSFRYLNRLELTAHCTGNGVRSLPVFIAALTPKLQALRLDLWSPDGRDSQWTEGAFRTDYWVSRMKMGTA